MWVLGSVIPTGAAGARPRRPRRPRRADRADRRHRPDRRHGRAGPEGDTGATGATGPAGPAGSALIGELRMVAGATTPTGWLECSGQAVSRTTYAALFAEIGTAYGPGDGSTTFNVPDYRGRVPMGAGTGLGGGAAGAAGTKPAAGAALTARARGAWGGRETHTLATAEMPTHNHTAGTAGQYFVVYAASTMPYGAGGPGGDAAFAATANAGGGGAHPNDQPWLAARMLIYAAV